MHEYCLNSSNNCGESESICTTGTRRGSPDSTETVYASDGSYQNYITIEWDAIDEDVLYDALRDKKIAGAGLDAFAKEPPEFDSPVYKLPNVIVQPHTVAGTDGTMRKRADFAVENLKRYFDGKALEGQIFKRL